MIFLLPPNIQISSLGSQRNSQANHSIPNDAQTFPVQTIWKWDPLEVKDRNTFYNKCFPGGFKFSPRQSSAVTYQCRVVACGTLASGSTEGDCIKNCRGNLKLTKCNYPHWNLARVLRFNIITHPGPCKDPLWSETLILLFL